MTTSKILLTAALLSSIAAVSFAQTPVASKLATSTGTAPTAVSAPADTAPVVKKHHHKHHAKKAVAAARAASATK